MKINRYLLASLLLLIVSQFSVNAQALKSVDLSNSDIQYLGTKYIYHEKIAGKTQVSFTRHNKSVLTLPKKQTNFNSDKARTNSGIVINFVTDSKQISLDFTALPKINRGSDIAAYQVVNGKDIQIKTAKYSPKKPSFTFKFSAPEKAQQANQPVEYKVVLPSLANLALTALAIEPNTQLFAIESKRKAKYIAMGDSISHGVGQGSASYLTYPYQVAQELDLELFNLAVGGAQVSVPTAKMLKDFKDIKVISLLIGYNDWNAPNADLATFKTKYASVIDTTLKLHPEADLYCITPLFTRRDKAKHSPLPIQAYRDAIINLVTQRQAASKGKLHLIHGDKITSIKNLRTDKLSDPVHLGVEGAQLFAQELITIFRQ